MPMVWIGIVAGIEPGGSTNHPTGADGDEIVPMTCNILVSSAGRRVSLLRHFRESLAMLGVRGEVMAADLTAATSAFQAADRSFHAPLFASGEFIPEMLRICRENAIGLLIPTIDTELDLFAAHRDEFDAIGTTISISDPETVTIGCDKQRTYKWLRENDLPAPRQTSLEELRTTPGELGFPLIAKPRFGSSSVGMRRLANEDDVRRVQSDDPMVVQSLAPGAEYTVDVYLDAAGKAQCSVPRKRLETRAGEVSKGMAVRHEEIQRLAKEVCERLPEPRGVFNVQIFHDADSGAMNIIEFNPRFGGGYPLSHRAGAHFTTWLIEESLGLPCSAVENEWRDGLVMLRYDDAVFVSREQAGV